jgi:hypothetical protein
VDHHGGVHGFLPRVMKTTVVIGGRLGIIGESEESGTARNRGNFISIASDSLFSVDNQYCWNLQVVIYLQQSYRPNTQSRTWNGAPEDSRGDQFNK